MFVELLKLKQDDEDQAREARITEHMMKLQTARTPEERRRHLKAMEEEIKARSPRQIAWMERRKGLR